MENTCLQYTSTVHLHAYNTHSTAKYKINVIHIQALDLQVNTFKQYTGSAQNTRKQYISPV